MYVMMGPGGYLIIINKTWSGEKWREKAQQFFFLCSTQQDYQSTILSRCLMQFLAERTSSYVLPSLELSTRATTGKTKSTCYPSPRLHFWKCSLRFMDAWRFSFQYLQEIRCTLP